MRFVLISFAFMAWGFYELSGGSDFDPDAVRAARMAELDLDAPVEPAKAEPQSVAVIEKAPDVFVDTDPPLKEDVARVSLNLTTLDAASSEPESSLSNAAAETDAQTVVDVAAAVNAATDSVPQNVSNVTSSADTPAIIPSLIDPDDGVTEAAEQPSVVVGFQDLRTVSGDRVNVRGGPGTDFGVVGRLTRGAEILVLEDNGAGWVRFETTDGSTSGWMADFLLNSG